MNLKSDLRTTFDLLVSGEIPHLVNAATMRLKRATVYQRQVDASIDALRDLDTASSQRLADAFRTATDGSFGRRRQALLDDVEARRADLQRDQTEVTYEFHGQKDEGLDATPESDTERVCDLPKCSSRYGKLLTVLTDQFGPGQVLELGTCLGISGAYIGAGLGPDGHLTTIEAAEPQAEIARETFVELEMDDQVTVRNELFYDFFEGNDETRFDMVFLDGHHNKAATLAYFDEIYERTTDEAIVVFDDVNNFSDGMTEAWELIRDDDRVDLAVSTLTYGITLLHSSVGERPRFEIKY